MYTVSPKQPCNFLFYYIPYFFGYKLGGGGYCQIWAIWVCAAVKGIVFKQFTLG